MPPKKPVASSSPYCTCVQIFDAAIRKVFQQKVNIGRDQQHNNTTTQQLGNNNTTSTAHQPPMMNG